MVIIIVIIITQFWFNQLVFLQTLHVMPVPESKFLGIIIAEVYFWGVAGSGEAPEKWAG